jgi:hypothetical protein
LVNTTDWLDSAIDSLSLKEVGAPALGSNEMVIGGDGDLESKERAGAGAEAKGGGGADADTSSPGVGGTQHGAQLGGAIGQIGAEAGAGGQLVPCVRKAGLGHGRSIIHGKAPDKEAQGRCGIRRRKRR